MTMTMVSWDSLPAELRLTILEYVAGANPNHAQLGPRESSARHTYDWAPYAAVSRDWQVFFERRTFAAIALFNDDVQPFCDAVGRCAHRLAYVARLRLTIDLPEYTCDESETDEDAATVKRYVFLFLFFEPRSRVPVYLLTQLAATTSSLHVTCGFCCARSQRGTIPSRRNGG